MVEQSWIEYFLNIKGHELFVEVDHDFIVDQFNLTDIPFGREGVHNVISYITGPAPEEFAVRDEDDELPDLPIDITARQVYGLIHARYIMSPRGQQKMLAKYLNGEYGRCPRALCRSQCVLPIGLHEKPNRDCVKLFCPKCEDVYHPVSRAQSVIDGAFFGGTAAILLFQSYPKHLPRRSSEQFVLKLYGFKLHDHAQLARWQQNQREEMERQLRNAQIQ